ncbi:MAG TPA: galactose-1-epimerase, partial [Burkholderiales bacterium]|nr:galactose-1-epimerase [Burkholderiales bacterium]
MTRYTVTDGASVQVSVSDYGATLLSVTAPDRNGEPGDILLGFDTLEGYLGEHPYFGGTIGRYANRIAGGRFVLDGTAYQLACNNGPNHLHGGTCGFDRKLWDAHVTDAAELVFTYVSGDGEEGYPGRLKTEVRYRLEGGDLLISYRAQSDRATIV